MLGKDSLYWFLSADAQVFGAIVGVLGIFIVYSLQQIQQSVEWARNDLIGIMSRLVKEDYSKFSLHVQLNKIRGELKHQRESGYNQTEEQAIKEAEEEIRKIDILLDRKREILNNLKCLLPFLIAILALETSVIPFVGFYEKNLVLFNIGLTILLVANVVAFIWLALFIFEAIKR